MKLCPLIFVFSQPEGCIKTDWTDEIRWVQNAGKTPVVIRYCAEMLEQTSRIQMMKVLDGVLNEL